tara:strand:+ start:1285 stop:1827 length:543 start_codon:yes stop_codon:yes gene_type:complete
MNNKITLYDKDFKVYIKHDDILTKVKEIGKEISENFKDKDVILIGILNGSFMFLSDLAKHISINCSISFIKVSSYENTNSTGKVTEILGLSDNIENKNVIIVEDIIDSGLTVKNLRYNLEKHNPKDITICSLFYKPNANKYIESKPDYSAFSIDNQFIVGYGLDYNGLGRNLKNIYKLSE